MGVTPGKVQEIDAGKSDQESAKQRESVDWVVRVESAEEDKGGTEGGGGERYVVERVDDVSGKAGKSFVEVIHLSHNAYGR